MTNQNKPDGYCVRGIKSSHLWQVFKDAEEAEEAYPERERWQIKPVKILDMTDYAEIIAILESIHCFDDSNHYSMRAHNLLKKLLTREGEG